MTKRFLTLLLSLLILGCPPKPESRGSSDSGTGDILVGEFGSMTGPQATFGASTHNGITLAIDEVNAAGGIGGRKIKVLLEDDQSRQEEAANAVSKLISQNGVVAILGEVASSCSIAAAPICQKNHVPMITPSSTNPRVTKLGDYVFRMCFIDTDQGPVMAKYTANELKLKRAAILTDIRNDYSTGLSEVFAKTYAENGGTIVAHQNFANGDSDFRSQLTSIKAASPDFIYVPGYYTDVGQIAMQARDLGMKQPLVGGDGWESPKLFEIGGRALDGSMYSNHYHVDDPSPAVKTFVDKYEQRFGAKPDALAALAYDAARVLADAMKRAGKLEGPALRDAIAATKNFSGVTGTITLGPDRNPVGKKLVVLEVQNNKTLLKATIDPNAPAK